ncbi:phosphate starvation-inducible protein, PhoH-like protein [Candidatus Methylomirabilis lanthanidiphila]|uniref:PhoH-like protein n=1 Tax=Candidatus Methylomirabilis lanthanidiphila TaxID=2211376 RepID=A0A564ZKW8_9BACT|nr:PhoH family protein [Candidatus Methylomirabilis lanthanidiphila]VUZ85756.1 phosphate starvation-inducible protein, PhoH-like protein [Candidatus Methylomirabilis lanthanidiphila]
MTGEQVRPDKKVSLPIGEEIQQLFGRKDEVRKLIEETLQVKLVARDGLISIQGEASDVAVGEQVVSELISQLTRGERVAPQDVKLALRLFMKKEEEEFKRIQGELIEVSSKKRPVRPKGSGQRRYIEAIRRHDIVFAIGPAGTGKTYLAMAMAVSALLKHEVSRIILTRPAVEAGEKLGFLPGTLYEKINPYLRPLYDALYDMIELERVTRLIEMGTIEIAPLAFMRGRTLNDSFIILDEAQNTTSEQMKMFLTRLGFGSRTVITGDITQVDLPAGRLSGLIEVQRILKGIEGIKFAYLSEEDVVRHELVQQIVRAYEAYQTAMLPAEGR